MKSLSLKTLILTIGMASTSSWAFSDAYKLMLIDDGELADFIELGQYQKALEPGKLDTTDPNKRFVNDVNRCVASIRLSLFEDAETLCSSAIKESDKVTAPLYKRRRLTSFALSNRALARMMLSKPTAAITDLYEASRLSPNSFVQANLEVAKVRMQLTD